jgi:glycyl-tRNA synthetase
LAEQVTVDYDTKEDKTVTLRDRDSMKQVRIAIERLPEIVSALVEGTKTFAELK